MNRRKFLKTSTALCLSMSGEAQAFIRGGFGTGTQAQAQILRLGAGGWIRDMDIALSDNTMVCQTDTYGAYWYNAAASNPGNAGGTGAWQQLVSTQSMPNGDPATTVQARQVFGPLGVYAIRIAPSNTSVFYMLWMGYVYKSTNKGSTWTNTNASFTPIARGNCDPNETGGGGSGDATYGPKMVIDPNTPNVMYLGLTGTGPPWYTLDGGTTWSQAGTAGLPSPSVGSYSYAFGYAPGSSTTLYCFVNGVGCYRSTNAGSNSTTWTKISGSGTSTTGLTSCRRLFVDSQGSVWVTDDSGSTANNLWRFKSGSWTNFTISINTSFTYHAIAEDTTVASGARIVLGDDFNVLTQTGNAQAGTPTWTGSNNSPNGGVANIGATDIPYLQAAGTGGTLSSGYTLGNDVFDNAGNLWWASGVGVFKGNPPATFSSGGNTWGTFNSVSTAIEQLVADKIISPPGGSLVTGNWDRAFLQLPTPHKYATTVFPLAFANSPGGQDLDWASSSPSTIIGVTAFGGCQVSGNGGSSWTSKTSVPTSNVPGYLCVAAATPSNFLAMPSNGNMQYSTDGGVTWIDLGSYFNANFSVALNSMSIGNNIGSPDKLVCADRVNTSGGGTFYALVNLSAGSGGGIYRTVNGGAAWTKQSAINGTNGIPSGMVTTVGTPSGYHPQLRSVNGKAGHLLCCGGPTNQGSHPYTAQTNTMISTDGGVTWADLSSLARDVWNIDTGVTVGSYPRIFIWGWVNVAGTFTPGIFYSDDQGSTWTKIANQEMWGTLDLPMHLEADKTNAGQVYVGRTGSGYDYFGV